jgi:septum formation inhibitor MinC
MITDELQFIDFFDNNHTLFKDHLILIMGECSLKIKKYLDIKKLTYVHDIVLPKGRRRKALEEELKAEHADVIVSAQIAQCEVDRLSAQLQNNLTVLDEMVRSGREVDIKGDLLLLNRVNSGATITTTGNIIITKVVEGAIRCSGNFMLLSASRKANIIFQGVEVDNSLLEDRLTRVELKNNEIIITPVLKKEINWAL